MHGVIIRYTASEMGYDETPLSGLNQTQLLERLKNMCGNYNTPNRNKDKENIPVTSSYIPSSYGAYGTPGGSHNRVPGP